MDKRCSQSRGWNRRHVNDDSYIVVGEVELRGPLLIPRTPVDRSQ